MSRAWRIEFDGALYHVLSRGNEKRDIFSDDEDRRIFIKLMGEMAERFSIEIYAYVLMNNHYHILIKTQKANLSAAMQWFGVTYTSRYNIRHERSGHLFQGRFKSFLVENDAYLMRLSCYIHRNPVRQGVAERLADYKWSSYLAYAYGENALKWLKTKIILSQFKGELKEKRVAYRRKVQRYSDEEKKIWEDFKHGLFLGSQGFVDDMREKYLPEELHKDKPQQKEVKKSFDIAERLERASVILSADLKKIKMSKRLTGEIRIKKDLLIYTLWETGIYRNEEIGKLFGVSYSAVSKSVSNIRKKRIMNEEVKRSLASINSLFKM